MKIVELILNEEDENAGIDAVSLVEKPAIESDWVALKKHEVQLKTINEDKRLLMGAALIPNKQIYRRNEKTNEEYYIFFSKDTVRKASQLFLKESNQNNATIEHTKKIDGMSVVESWIKEGKQDKSNLYGFDAEPGTWFITMKVENDEIWNKVKSKEIKGFSIEGYFAEKLEASKQEFKSVVVDEDIAIIDDRNAYSTKEKALQVAKDVGCEGYHEHEFEGKTWYMPCEKHTEAQELESYSDYPQSVSNNAKRGIELNEKNDNKCATQTGKVRAQQLAQGKAITEETIKRMYSYLSRAKTYYDDADTNDCGNISYLLWGGLAGLRWSESKLKELGKLEATQQERDKQIIEELKKMIKEYETKKKKKKKKKKYPKK